MALDQVQLLQMLLQGGGGGGAPQPTSGLQDPSLSGLALGPQGMGFGGGESLLGGGAAGLGGGSGGKLGGLDLSQLLAQLQAAPGVTGAGLGTGIGAMSLGGFGAGGQMGQESLGSMPTPSQQGQAGLGAANTTAQLLGLIKEGTGLGKALLSLFPKGPTATDLQGLNLPELTAFAPSIGSNLSSLEQLSAANPGLFSLTGQVSPIPALNPSKFAGAFGGLSPFNTGGIETLGPGGAPALAGELGPAGSQIPQVTPGLLDSFGGLSNVLGGAGILTNLGFGALNLAQGNLGPGIGGILGTAGGLGLGAALAPETAGLSLLLGGLGGGAGSLLGGLFGGGGGGLFGGGNPRDAQRKAAEVNRNVTAAFPALQNDLKLAQTQGDVQQAIDNFTFRVADTGFGLGFATGQGPGILPSPPGGRFDALVSQFQPAIAQMLQTLPEGAASRVSDFGKAMRGERAAAREAQAAQQRSDVNRQTGIPPALLTQSLASGGSIAGADTRDPAVWSALGRVFGPGFGEGGG